MENDKLSIETPMMNQHALYAHAKKLEEMIKRLADKIGHDLKNDMFSLERAFNLLDGSEPQPVEPQPVEPQPAASEPQTEAGIPESVESSEPHSNS